MILELCQVRILPKLPAFRKQSLCKLLLAWLQRANTIALPRVADNQRGDYALSVFLPHTTQRRLRPSLLSKLWFRGSRGTRAACGRFRGSRRARAACANSSDVALLAAACCCGSWLRAGHSRISSRSLLLKQKLAGARSPWHTEEKAAH